MFEVISSTIAMLTSSTIGAVLVGFLLGRIPEIIKWWNRPILEIRSIGKREIRGEIHVGGRRTYKVRYDVTVHNSGREVAHSVKIALIDWRPENDVVVQPNQISSVVQLASADTPDQLEILIPPGVSATFRLATWYQDSLYPIKPCIPSLSENFELNYVNHRKARIELVAWHSAGGATRKTLRLNA